MESGSPVLEMSWRLSSGTWTLLRQRTVRCVQEYSGHSSAIMSLDFHPKKTELFCYCDGENEIRFWNINSSNCFRATKGVYSRVRFQPRLGHLPVARLETNKLFPIGLRNFPNHWIDQKQTRNRLPLMLWATFNPHAARKKMMAQALKLLPVTHLFAINSDNRLKFVVTLG